MTLTSIENLKWIPTPFTQPCPKKILKMLLFPKNELKGTIYVQKIALITLLRMQRTIFSSKLAILPTRNMIRKSRVFLLKNSGVQNCCVCVAKPIFATIEKVTSTNSVAGDSIKELWKTVEMDQCESIATCSKRQSTLLQPIEDFERFSIVLLGMNKQKRIALPVSKKSSRTRWNTHKILTLVNLILVLNVGHFHFYTF